METMDYLGAMVIGAMTVLLGQLALKVHSEYLDRKVNREVRELMDAMGPMVNPALKAIVVRQAHPDHLDLQA
jgi:hypothetical protein